jgi:hypothetical protein
MDNDCDGDVDGADADCASANMAATCALAYRNGKPGKECGGWHFIQYSVSGAGPDATVSAELLALATEGNVLTTIPDVQVGDMAHLRSRLDPSDFKVKSKISKKGNKPSKHEIFAPVPMLRVIADDGNNRAEAYCSNIPFLQVVKPNGDVSSASEANLIKVVAAIPRDDLSTLFVKIDGVDILTEMGIDPSTDFPGGPFTDTIMIGGENVTISDLTVQGAAIETLSSNTLTMTVSNLGCGGHIIVVDAEQTPGIILPQTTPECHDDDVRDKGTASVFAINIDSPTEGSNTSTIPTPVTGEVCHGREITSTKVNGKSVDVAGQVTVPGDGEDSADTVTLAFNESLGQTNILSDILGTNTTIGTFDQGANTAYVTAEDDLGNRTAADANFTIGGVGTATASLSVSPAQQAQIDGVIQTTLEKEIRAAIASNGTTIQDAFVLGIEEAAIDTFFTETCAAATADVKTSLVQSINNLEIPSKTMDVLCDPVVHYDLKNAAVGAGDVTCNVQTGNGVLIVTVATPPISMTATAKGDCCSGCDFICWHSVDIDVAASASITPEFNLVLTEDQFLALATGTSSTDRSFARMRLLSSSGPDVSQDDVDIGCIVGFLADVFNFLGDVFFLIFTFGQVDNPIRIDVSMAEALEDLDIQAALGVLSFPVEIMEVMLDQKEFQNEMKLLTSDLERVKLRPDGLTASLSATVSPTMEDPEVDSSTADDPDLTPASTPMPVLADADNTFFVISDDLLNQLFSSMTVQGEVNTLCIESKKCTAPPSKEGDTCSMNADCDDAGGDGVCTPSTFGDIFPDNCDVLSLFPKARGICEAVKGTDCESLSFLVGKFKAQGACHGWKGDDCSTLVQQPLDINGNEQQACEETPFFNLAGNMPFLVCGKVNNPPAIEIMDDFDVLQNMPVDTDGIVETILRLNDLEMGLLVDRDIDGLSAEVAALPSCFQSGASTNGDCKLLATCLDLNFPTSLALIVGAKECVSPPSAEGNSCTTDGDCGTDGACRNPITLMPTVEGVQIITPKCTAPPANVGNACAENADCDTSMGSGDGVCETPGSDVCSGGFNFGGGSDADLQALFEASENNATNELMDNVDVASPMLDTQGLDLGGIVQFAQPKLFAVATQDACTNMGACLGNSCSGNSDCNPGTCSAPALSVGKPCCTNSECNPAPLGRCSAGLTGSRCLTPPKKKGETCSTDSDCDTSQCSAPPSKIGDACSSDSDCNVSGGDGVCGSNGVCKDECLFDDECDLVEDGEVKTQGVCTVDTGGVCNKSGSGGVCATGERIPGFEDYLGVTGDICDPADAACTGA